MNWFKTLFQAKPEQSTLAPDQAAWLLGSLVGMFRLAVQKSQVDAALGAAPTMYAVKTLLSEVGLTVKDLSVSQLLTREVLSAGPVVVSGEDALLLVLDYDGTEWTVVEDQTREPKKLLKLPAAAAVFQVGRQVRLDASQAEAFGWKWFSKEFFSNKAVIRDVLIGSLFIQLIAMTFPLATQAIVDKVITNQAQSTLIVLGVGILLMALFSAGLSWLRQYFLLRLSNTLDRRLSEKVLVHLFRLPIQFFEKRPTGTIINRVHVIEPIREFVAGAFMLAAIDLPFMLVFLALMVTYSVHLSGVVASFLAVMVASSFLVGPRLRGMAMQAFQLGAKVQGYLTEQVGAAETVKSLQLENDVQRRFAEMNQAQLDANLDLRELANRYGTFMSFMEQAMNATVLCVGAYLAMQGSVLTIGMLVAFQMFAQRVAQPLLKLSGLWQQFQQIRVSVAQLGDIMSVPTEAYSALATSLTPVKGHLKIEGLSFRYGLQSPLLYENLNLDVKPGQVVLITGPSGSGKSTLTKIIQGLYQQTGGAVRLDGRDIRTMPVTELRSHLGVVPQESVLFSGTILDNLIAAAPRASFQDVVKVCQMAGIHETIEGLPNGYQSEIGERGTGLSGGQRQRLAIARALLKNPKVLIFDESTSGLDVPSQSQVVETINSLRTRVTVLVITHQPDSGLHVDQHLILRSFAT